MAKEMKMSLGERLYFKDKVWEKAEMKVYDIITGQVNMGHDALI